VNKDKKETKIDKLEFNTYCIFTEEKQEVKEDFNHYRGVKLSKIKMMKSR